MKIEGFGFPCAVCGKPALELEFWPKGVEHPLADSKTTATIHIGLVARGVLRSGEVGTILVTSAGIGMVWAPDAERYAKLLEMARQHDVAGLAAAEFADAESYCPQCKKHYCGEHCRLSPVFDGDWVEGFETTCPHGHKKRFPST